MDNLACRLLVVPSHSSSQQWDSQVLSGRLTELCGQGNSAVLSVACDMVYRVQSQGEPAVWITVGQSAFYPPDVVSYGIDLDAVAVVRTSTAGEAARAADRLIRSAGFGLVVIDFGDQWALSMALLSRLNGLAQEHQVVLLCLTSKGADMPSMSSLVSLRGQTYRRALGPMSYECGVDIIKDKRCGPGWTHRESHSASPGLR